MKIISKLLNETFQNCKKLVFGPLQAFCNLEVPSPDFRDANRVANNPALPLTGMWHNSGCHAHDVMRLVLWGIVGHLLCHPPIKGREGLFATRLASRKSGEGTSCSRKLADA